MKKIIILFIVLLGSLSIYAQQPPQPVLRGGDISYKADPEGRPNTFLITITLYSNANNGIDGLDVISLPPRVEGPYPILFFGDGQFVQTFNRENGPNHAGEIVSPGIRKNVYTLTHAYP